MTVFTCVGNTPCRWSPSQHIVLLFENRAFLQNSVFERPRLMLIEGQEESWPTSFEELYQRRLKKRVKR